MSRLLTVDHPDVQTYLTRLGILLPRAENATHDHPTFKHNFYECTDRRWHDRAGALDGLTSWWRVEYGGIAHPEGVANALGRPDSMSLDDARTIFALAALAVFSRPSHPAHWAFWARNSRQRVAELVQEVVCEKARRIVVPTGAGWIDPEHNMGTLRNWQRSWIPQTPRPPGVHIPMPVEVKKKRTRAARKPVGRAAVQRTATPRVRVADTVVKNANGKRVAQWDQTAETAEARASKRVKRSATVAAVGTGVGGAEKARGGRITRANTAQAVGTTPQDTPPKPSSARKSRARVGATKKRGQTQAPPTIHVVPPHDADETMEVDVEGAAGPSVVPPRAIHTGSLRQYATPPNLLAACMSSSPLTEPPSTPTSRNQSSDPPSPSPKRPAGRCLRRGSSSGATSDSSEEPTPLAANSPTAVPSTSAPSRASTRVGTPLDLETKAEEMNADAGLSTGSPVRVSARIRAKRGSQAAPSPAPTPKRTPQTRRV